MKGVDDMSTLKTIVIYVLSVMLAFFIGICIPIIGALASLSTEGKRSRNKISYHNYYSRGES